MRSERYRGDLMSVSLSEIGPDDQHAIRALYRELLHVQEKLAAIEVTSVTVDAAHEIAGWPEWMSLLTWARNINAGMTAYGERIARVLHDIRGGSLVALLGTGQMLAYSASIGNDLVRCAYFARDHLKIMRNCVSDIDEARRERDRQDRPHHVDLLIEKWSRGEFTFEGEKRRVELRCAFFGNLSQRCLEFSALDRVLYNLVNNAARHTADGDILLAVLPVEGANSRNVRIVVANAITPAQAASVQALAGEHGERLMLGGLSTTGGGIGLRICGEFVAHAFGLRSVVEVVTGGYAGTRVLGTMFASWVHWPALG